MKSRPRLMLIFRCDMTPAALERIRSALDLTGTGRLTDPEDAEFGYRHLRRGADIRPAMELWRGSEIWWLSISATDDVAFTAEELSAWRTEMAQAVSDSGGTVVEERLYADRNEQARRAAPSDADRNENWLRTIAWSLPAQTLDELFHDLGVGPGATAEQRRTKLAEFVRTPTWEPAPDHLKRAAAEFLRGQ